MTHMLLCHGGVLASQAMTPVEHMSTYWSAAIHDYGERQQWASPAVYLVMIGLMNNLVYRAKVS